MAIKHLNDKTDGIYDNLLPNTQIRIIHRASNDQALRGAVNAGSILQVDSKGVVACLGPLSNRTLQGILLNQSINQSFIHLICSHRSCSNISREWRNFCRWIS